MTKTPSRILNEKMSFLSLSVIDIAGLGYLLIVTHRLLEPFGVELISFVILGVSAATLISIRIKYRSKTIRDYLSFKLSKKISLNTGKFL